MNIALIGMMGSGKTTVGCLLKEKISGFSFVDTDEEIVKAENMSINEIFAKKGENYFRKIETEILNKYLNLDNFIISTGGGVIKSEENIKNLKEKSLVIYLKADACNIYERIKNNKERPLLNSNDMKAEIENILSQRTSKYEQAHIVVDTCGKNFNIIIEEIIKKAGIDGKN